MKRKLLAVLSILVIVGMLPGSALAAPKPIDYSPMDAGPRIREMPATPEMITPISEADLAGEQAAAEAIMNASTTDCITATKIFLILNEAKHLCQRLIVQTIQRDAPAIERALSQRVWPQHQRPWYE